MEGNKELLDTDISKNEPINFNVFRKTNGNCLVLGQEGIGKPFIDIDKIIIKNWQLYKPNNWLKMHGIPMRRKPLKRVKGFIVVDEAYKVFER